MANRAIFEIAYGGPVVDDGTMDVRELAPALLALGNLVENSNRAIGDPGTPVKVVVRSNFEKGSFQITLEVIHTITEHLIALFDLHKADNLPEKILLGLGFISGGGISLLALLKRLRGRPVKKATVLENGNVRLELEGENGEFDLIEVNENVIRLYRDRSVRDNLERVLSPLEKAGVDSFAVKKDKEIIETITKDEAKFYKVPDSPEQEQSTTSTRRSFVNLIEVAFEEGLKWRLSDGDNKFYASIEDENFLKQMEHGKTFAKGDILKVEIETTQTATSKGIKNEHKVLEVIDHVSRPKQLEIPFDD